MLSTSMSARYGRAARVKSARLSFRTWAASTYSARRKSSSSEGLQACLSSAKASRSSWPKASGQLAIICKSTFRRSTWRGGCLILSGSGVFRATRPHWKATSMAGTPPVLKSRAIFMTNLPRRSPRTPTILEVMSDSNLLGKWFAGPSWAAWRTLFKALFALPLDLAEIEVFKACMAAKSRLRSVAPSPLWR